MGLKQYKNKRVIFGVAVFLTIVTASYIIPKVAATENQGFKVASYTEDEILLQENSSFLFADNMPILENQQQYQYQSEIINTKFDFNGIGLVWQSQAELPNIIFLLRLHNANGWSSWVPLELEADSNNNSQNNTIFSEPIFGQTADSFQYQIIQNSSDANINIDNLEFVYFDSTSGPNIIRRLSSQITNLINASSSSEINIISREEWGADESWRFTSDDQEWWPPQYQTPSFFVIHHTAGSTGEENPAATIRGVYYWHAQVLNWGDIGYNYLIDTQGNIYEGRYGGDGVIGAHTYNSYTNTNYNEGSIGISLLGNYENLTPADNALQTFMNLIADKSLLFAIEPDSIINYKDENLAAIVGHRDIDATLCPGENLYEFLLNIREGATEKLNQLRDLEIVRKASLVDRSEEIVEANPAEIKEVWVDFKNEGNTTWHNYTTNKVYIKNESSSGQVSILKTDDWLADNLVTTIESANVASGETTRFEFTIKAPEDRLAYTESFHLCWDEEDPDKCFADTSFDLTINVTGLDYAAELNSHNILPAMFTSGTYHTTIKMANMGTRTWTPENTYLNIYDLGDANNPYIDNSWNSTKGNFLPAETTVATGETATFEFKQQVPRQPGLYRQTYRLFVNDEQAINSEFTLVSRADSPFRAEYVSNTISPAMLNVWEIPVEIKFKNVGISPWHRSMQLQIWNEDYNLSQFKAKTWLNSYTVANLKEREVLPGEIGTFEFKLKAPRIAGAYEQIFELNLKNNKYIIQNGKKTIQIRVDQ